MAVPSYSAFFTPLLTSCLDGKAHKVRDLIVAMSDEMHLSAEDRSQTIKTGEPLVANRVWWARTYLVKANLLASPSRGHVQITDAGRKFLRQHPSGVALTDLKTIDAFAEWWRRSTGGGRVEDPLDNGSSAMVVATPEEQLEEAHTATMAGVSSDLLQQLQQCSPAAFERLVVHLLQRMGYGKGQPDAAQVLGRSGDGGVDGLINQDPLGVEGVYIQAKRWQGSVGADPVRSFVGSLMSRGASRGVFITTSSFTADAKAYVKDVKHATVVLIDGERLVDLMLDYEVGVERMQTYTTYRVDHDFFEGL